MKTLSNTKGKCKNDVIESAEIRGEPENRKRSSTSNQELNLIKKTRQNEVESEYPPPLENVQFMFLNYELGKHKVNFYSLASRLY